MAIGISSDALFHRPLLPSFRAALLRPHSFLFVCVLLGSNFFWLAGAGPLSTRLATPISFCYQMN